MNEPIQGVVQDSTTPPSQVIVSGVTAAKFQSTKDLMKTVVEQRISRKELLDIIGDRIYKEMADTVNKLESEKARLEKVTTREVGGLLRKRGAAHIRKNYNGYSVHISSDQLRLEDLPQRLQKRLKRVEEIEKRLQEVYARRRKYSDAATRGEARLAILTECLRNSKEGTALLQAIDAVKGVVATRILDDKPQQPLLGS